MFSTGKNDWSTPDDLFQRYNAIYNFVLDAAANSTNRKVSSYFGPGGLEEDALTADWSPWLKKGSIWLNPPYSRNLQRRFIEKVVNECVKFDAPELDVLNLPRTRGLVVCLLPARTDTKLFHEIIKPYAAEIEFLKGRVKFVGAEHGAPFPSMIVIF